MNIFYSIHMNSLHTSFAWNFSLLNFTLLQLKKNIHIIRIKFTSWIPPDKINSYISCKNTVIQTIVEGFFPDYTDSHTGLTSIHLNSELLASVPFTNRSVSENKISKKMPLPAALLARLKKRGIIDAQQEKSSELFAFLQC